MKYVSMCVCMWLAMMCVFFFLHTSDCVSGLAYFLIRVCQARSIGMLVYIFKDEIGL